MYATGILELVLAGGLLFRPTTPISAPACAALLIGFFPVNVHAAIYRVPYGGHALGPRYLLVRGPLQLLLLAWTCFMVIAAG